MLHTRVIPVLLLDENRLVKTIKFKSPKYVGDPINAIKIFNDKQVDELVILDISKSKTNSEPNYEIISKFATECFMPVCYGGGITEVSQIEKIFKLGIEKVCLNNIALTNKEIVIEAVKIFGSQSIVGSIDVKKNFFGKYQVYDHSIKKITKIKLLEYIKQFEKMGIGELFINSVDRDGLQTGYDIELLKTVSSATQVPVIACGGASSLTDLQKVKQQTSISAVAAGSMFVFHGKHRAVLISYPQYKKLRALFGENHD